MNIKKLFAGAVASAMAVTSLAAYASADVNFPYTATLGFADGSWAAQDWATTVEVKSISGTILPHILRR